jgi:hypothetical protein
VKFRGGNRAEDDGIIPPDHSLRADSPGEFAEGCQGVRQPGCSGINLPGIIEYRVLEVIPISPVVQFIQIRKERPGIAGPEDDGLHIFRLERYLGDLLRIKRVGDKAASFPDPVDEPPGIESGDIGSPAGADYHNGFPVYNWIFPYYYAIFIRVFVI